MDLSQSPSTRRRHAGSALAVAGLALAISACAPMSTPPPLGAPPEDRWASADAAARIVAVDFAPGSSWMGALLENRRVQIWDLLENRSVAEAVLDREPLGFLEVGGPRRFAVLHADGVEVWDADKGRESVLPLAGGVPELARFDGAGKRLAVALRGGGTLVAPLGKALDGAAPSASGPCAGPLHGHGARVLCLSGPRQVRVFDLFGDGEPRTFSTTAEPRPPLALSAAGGVLAFPNDSGGIDVEALSDGGGRASIGGVPAPSALALSPDGSLLASVSGGVLELREVASGEVLDRQEIDIWPAGGLHFSDQGQFLAWVEAKRRKLRFWFPLGDLVVWKNHQPVVAGDAAALASDAAALLRYSKARAPFQRGAQHQREGRPAEALKNFEAAWRLFPALPGLAEARRRAEDEQAARLEAPRVDGAVKAQLAAGEYGAALAELDGYLQRFPAHDRPAFRALAAKLRPAVAALEEAERFRSAGRAVDALAAFQSAAPDLPDLRARRPAFEELRLAVEAAWSRDLARAAAEAADALRIAGEIVRLRPLEPGERLAVGRALEAGSRHGEAMAVLEDVPQPAAEFEAARTAIARIAARQGDLARARQEFERAGAGSRSGFAFESDYAEALEALGDIESAVQAWTRAAAASPAAAAPLERLGILEERRQRWKEAGAAFLEAARRAQPPRPELLLRGADALRHAGERGRAFDAYAQLRRLADAGAEIPGLGAAAAPALDGRIRQLGFARHREEWIPWERFLTEQGWTRHGDEWLRPEELRLRDIARSHSDASPERLRQLPSDRYRSEVGARRIAAGMTREEALEAWGYFTDQNVFRVPERAAGDGAPRGAVVFEQWLYPSGRQVYLREGLVCFWSE
jgi:tetratricopeptide (TPR) repeat protein